MKHTKARQRSIKKSILLTAGVAVFIVAGVSVLELTNVTHFFHKKKIVAQTASQYTKGEKSDSKPTVSSSTSTTNATHGSATSSQSVSTPPSAAGQQKQTTTDATLQTPSGNFVSDHHPNLSGSPHPNDLTSVCATTPGASCSITFTKDGVTKSLAARTADAGGSAYWDWKLQDLSLTAGSWHIQANASLNGQTKTADDAMDLVVSP